MALPRFQQRDHIYVLGPPLLPTASPVPQLPNETPVLASVAPGQRILGLPVQLDKDAPWVMRRRAMRIRNNTAASPYAHVQTGINQVMLRYSGHDQQFVQRTPVPQNLDGAFFGQNGAWKPVYPGLAFPAGGTFLVDIVNNGPLTLTNLTLYFRGVKLFPWGVRPDYRYPKIMSGSAYWYPINRVTSSNPLGTIQQLLTTELRLSQSFQVLDDADFVVRAMATGPTDIFSCFEVFLQIRDFDQKPYSTGWVHSEIYGGQTVYLSPTANLQQFPIGSTGTVSAVGTGASLPNVFFPEIYMPKNQILFYDILRQDAAFVSGGSNAVTQDYPITLIGQKVFDRR